MPDTTVQNTIGAISIFTSAMKPSASGFKATACCGEKCPNNVPATIATSTRR